ncbi:peptidyl-prolyl cis-trans isomerase [Caulobacter segnis]|uniref:peptidylprolyl isomerase n=1 Tax=Caulobacter segnis TaxID=88688 RepID=UPI001CC11A36|nr:peptidyl-prolyl cis-trans isomerase [Caulobacter segnis]UAL11498.1 peptidyl-prolyl cis-trans isomerase [Caulobacter segnis]
MALKTTFRLMGVLSACALLLVACGQNKVAEKPPEPGDTAVARVNGQVIWASDVKREAVAQGLISEGEPLDVSSEVFRQRLDEVIDQKLLAAEAAKRKIDKDPIAQRRLAAARERILGDMLVEGVVEKAVTEDAIRKLYAEQQKLSKRSEEIRARQIIVGSQAEAESVKKLLASGASFDALAMERSTDQATRFNGGDLGYFTLDVMPEPYGVALKDAQKGALVGPFAAEGGWVLVRVEDKRTEEPITLEAARPQIVRFLTYDQVRDILEKLRGSAKVEMLIGKAQDASVTGAQEPASAPPEAPVGAPASAPPPPAQPAKK